MAFTSSPAHSPSLSSSQVHVATRDMSRHDQEPMTNNTSTTTRTPASPPSSSSVYCSTTTLADRRKTKTSQYLVSDDFKSDFATKLSRFRTQCDSHFVPPRTHIPLTNYHHQDFSTIHELDETVLSGTDRNTTDIHQHSNPAAGECGSETTSAWRESGGEDQRITCTPSTSTLSEEEEGAEEQQARYEVIGKLADELAGQIEQNDALLYELGVMRANHARLQALAADREDELTCLNQRIHQLEATVLKSNSNETHHHPIQDLLPSTLAPLHQLSHAPASHTSPACVFDTKVGRSNQLDHLTLEVDTLFLTQMRHTRRYSWSGARPASSLQTLSSKVIEQCPPGASRQARMHHLSEVLSTSKDPDFLVDHMSDRGSLKAYVHELQAELAHKLVEFFDLIPGIELADVCGGIYSRMVCAATEATLRTVMEASGGRRSSEGTRVGEARVQGLGLMGAPIEAAEGREGTDSGGRWEQRRSMSSSSSSPLRALASLGAFGGWGRNSSKLHHPASPSSPCVPQPPTDPAAGRPDRTNNNNNPGAVIPFLRLASFFVQPSTTPSVSSGLKHPVTVLEPTHNSIII
ncbi:hypothetical protein VP01_1919g5 [Puccinia sorghi]|uniref:Uncharacterized protein n=1 Tax=Puccinia sorghi TaxID=27349 RepID=A0A0L6VCR6_9BASI|nr:hypothetical protein VP01_1919g5 [Puccinia sorghi]